MLGDFLLEILCGGLFWLFLGGGGVSDEIAASHRKTRNLGSSKVKSLTPAQRRLQQMQNCSIESCNALTYRASNYCLRHQPSMLEEIVSEPEPEPDPQAEANWWEDQKE